MNTSLRRHIVPGILLLAAIITAGYFIGSMIWPRGGGQTAKDRTHTKTLHQPANPGRALVGLPSETSLIHSLLHPAPPFDHAQMIGRIDALPDTLTEPESMEVCRALRDGLPGYATISPGQRHHVANQLLNLLLRQKASGEWLAKELTVIWKSGGTDETIRDYALQHLAQLMEGRGPESPHLETWRADGLPVLIAAARDSGTRSSGTAILALHFLTAASGPAGAAMGPVAEFDSIIETVAKDNAAHPAARAAAFQAAAARGRDGLLPVARLLAGDASVSSGLRVGAIHYLGVFGAGADDTLLARLEAEKDLRFTAASRAARARLTTRHP